MPRQPYPQIEHGPLTSEAHATPMFHLVYFSTCVIGSDVQTLHCTFIYLVASYINLVLVARRNETD